MEATELFCYRDQVATIDKQGKGGEAFVVEDLLDFSNDDDGLCAGDDLGFGAVLDDSTLTALDSTSDSSSGSDSHFPGNFACRGVADAGLSDGLSVPYDEIAELEWLSNFVEESFSDEDLQRLQLISGAAKSSSPSLENEASGEQKGAVPAKVADAPFPEKKIVPAKARSKRSRPAPSSWSSRLLVLTTGTSASGDPEGAVPAPNSNPGGAPPPRKVPKAGKKKEAAGTEGPAPAPDGRRCLHCNTDKTPQWRTGPMGPKTLCNACGVRYKSGRLVAEYRPAASPTFVPSLHSNSHRKVLELLRQKEQRQRTAAAAAATGQFLHPGEVFDPPEPPAADDLLLHHHLGPDFRQLI